MKSLAVKIWLSVLLLLVAAYAAYSGFDALRRYQDSRRNSSEFELRPIRPLSDFEFTERDGRQVRLAELEGKVFAVNFFFANCPGTCRLLNDKVAALHKKFGPKGARFVSLTIDPASDTAPKLADYAKAFGADENWWFVTGPLENTQDLGRALQLAAVGRDQTGNLTHTDQIVLFDRNGVMRGQYDHRQPAEMKAAERKLEELLAEEFDSTAAWGAPADKDQASDKASDKDRPSGQAQPSATGAAAPTPTSTAAASKPAATASATPPQPASSQPAPSQPAN